MKLLPLLDRRSPACENNDGAFDRRQSVSLHFTILISGGVGSIGPVGQPDAHWTGEPRSKSIGECGREKRAMSGKNDATTWEETTMFRARTIILALGITTTLGSASFAQTPVDPNGAPNP
jgi:hypothetical protein